MESSVKTGTKIPSDEEHIVFYPVAPFGFTGKSPQVFLAFGPVSGSSLQTKRKVTAKAIIWAPKKG